MGYGALGRPTLCCCVTTGVTPAAVTPPQVRGRTVSTLPSRSTCGAVTNFVWTQPERVTAMQEPQRNASNTRGQDFVMRVSIRRRTLLGRPRRRGLAQVHSVEKRLVRTATARSPSGRRDLRIAN